MSLTRWKEGQWDSVGQCYKPGTDRGGPIEFNPGNVFAVQGPDPKATHVHYTTVVSTAGYHISVCESLDEVMKYLRLTADRAVSEPPWAQYQRIEWPTSQSLV